MNKSNVAVLLSQLLGALEARMLVGESVIHAQNLCDSLLEDYLVTKKGDTKPTQKKKQTVITSEVVEKARELLRNETKPSYVLLQKKLKLSKPQAIKLFGVVNTKKPSIDKLIQELPDGTDTLVNPPFQFFGVLPEKRRAKYLMGLEVKDIVSAEAIATARKTGADKSLALQIMSLTKVARVAVTNPVTISETGNAEAQKYARFIKTKIGMVGSGGDDLYNHMTLYGVNKEVLLDLQNIAKAVKAGDL